MKSSWSDRPPSSNSPSDQGRKIKRNQGSATFSYCSTSNNSNSHIGSFGNSSNMSYVYDHDLTQQSSSFSYDDGQGRRELAARQKTNQAFDRLATTYAALRFDQAQLWRYKINANFNIRKPTNSYWRCKHKFTIALSSSQRWNSDKWRHRNSDTTPPPT